MKDSKEKRVKLLEYNPVNVLRRNGKSTLIMAMILRRQGKLQEMSDFLRAMYE